MKTHPPAIATWLLERLIRRSQREALIGDLFEEFIRRGSPHWYWGQMLKAIAIDFAHRARTEWFAVVFAGVWITMLAQVWPHIMMTLGSQPLIWLGIGWPWPLSLLCYVAIFTAATTVSLWIGLVLYFVLTRRFECRSLLRGMAVTSVLDLAINTGSLFFVGRHRVGIYMISWLPLFVALLVSMIAGRAVGSRGANKSTA